ncbi:MAG TPA: S41 family peptidase [Chloroflexota bacterium]|nr:S41 family peptidase [Chloroflexota bacterium]
MHTARLLAILRRLLPLVLALVLAAGPLSLALAFPTTAPTSQERGLRDAAAVDTALRVLQEAYELLLERYALPLDPATLTSTAQEGMVAALQEAGVEQPVAGLSAPGSDPLQQWNVLRQRFQAFAARYGQLVAPRELAYAAIKAMADSTDDSHTSFMTPEQYQEHLRWTRGEVRYGGIGARMRGPLPTVVEVFANTPAEAAGLRPGDTIVSVDGRPTSDLRLEEVVNLVRGEEGTSVVLGVQRAGSERVDELTLVRAQVSVPFVEARRLADDLGYVRLRGFPEPSVIEQVEQAVLQYQREGVRGLILDLRGNSGGRLDVGTRLLARFVPNGPIYQVVDRNGRHDTFTLRDARPILTVPLVVLIDEGTASMGEIFAAAIQEHQVGRVLGTTTAGSVAASVVFPLSDGSALQLSVELVYSGAGRLLDRVGVKPDEEVDLDLTALRAGHDVQLERAISYLRERAAQPSAPATVGAP